MIFGVDGHFELGYGSGNRETLREASMNLTAEQILNSAMSLSESQRPEIAEALLADSGPPVTEPIDAAWLAELQHRSQEIDAGTVALTSWADVKLRVRARLEMNSSD